MEEQAAESLQQLRGINIVEDPYSAAVAQTSYNIFASMTQEGSDEHQAFEDTLLDDLKDELEEMENQQEVANG